MQNCILYIRKCPGDRNPRHFKIGITSLDSVRTRLATYQSSVGPIYEECFIHVWLGSYAHIREAEQQLKRNFADHIHSGEAGLSEWISDISLQEILDFIQKLREEYFIKMIDVPQEFQPLTIANYDGLIDWFALRNQGLT